VKFQKILQIKYQSASNYLSLEEITCQYWNNSTAGKTVGFTEKKKYHCKINCTRHALQRSSFNKYKCNYEHYYQMNLFFNKALVNFVIVTKYRHKL